MKRDAVISDCGTYRYLLCRTWDTALPAVCFIMLNPSTADAMQDDPTIRRCLGFAKSLGFGRLEVTNLFAYRATDPKDLYAAARAGVDVVGADNDAWLLSAAQCCALTICAWGNQGGFLKRSQKVLDLLLTHGLRAHALRVSGTGQPAHPLYLPGSLTPKELR